MGNILKGSFYFLLLFGGDLAIAADETPSSVYRWQDAEGRWHFGDASAKSPQVPAQPVDVTPSNIVKTSKTRVGSSSIAPTYRRYRYVPQQSIRARCDKMLGKFGTQERDYERDCPR